MGELNFKTMRVAFQGEPGAFSEAAAVQLLGESIRTVPRPTFDATFRAIAEGAADALLLPLENTLAGSVVRVYDLLLAKPPRNLRRNHSSHRTSPHRLPRRYLRSASLRRLPSHGSGAMRTFLRNLSPISSAFPPKTPPAASAK